MAAWPAVHLRPAGAGAGQLLQRRPTFAWPPHGFTTAVVVGGVAQRRRPRRAVDLGAGPAWSRPRSRWCSARWSRSPCSASGSSAATRVSLLIVLPIALPGIVTGIALDTAFARRSVGIGKGLLSVIVGHATFCIVTVFNNVLARLRRHRRQPRGGLGRPGRRTVQTFRFVTFPLMRSALLAGGLLAFALSFDEIIVTTFTAGPGVTDAAHLDLQQPVPAQPGAGRQRGRRRPDRAVGRPDLAGPAARRHRPQRLRRPVTRVRWRTP